MPDGTFPTDGRGAIMWAQVRPNRCAALTSQGARLMWESRRREGGDHGAFDEAEFLEQLTAGQVDETELWASANMGDQKAMCKLASQAINRALLSGANHDQLLAHAEEWLLRAIILNSVFAAGMLGFMLVDLSDDPREQQRGMCLLRLAAAVGDPTAMRNLGVVLTGSDDGSSCGEVAEGEVWLRHAASAGDALAAEMVDQAG